MFEIFRKTCAARTQQIAVPHAIQSVSGKRCLYQYHSEAQLYLRLILFWQFMSRSKQVLSSRKCQHCCERIKCRFLTELKPFSNVVVYDSNLNFAIFTQVRFYRQPSSVQNSLRTQYQHVLLGRFLFMALGHFTLVHCSERTVWSLIRVISSLSDH